MLIFDLTAILFNNGMFNLHTNFDQMFTASSFTIGNKSFTIW